MPYALSRARRPGDPFVAALEGAPLPLAGSLGLDAAPLRVAALPAPLGAVAQRPAALEMHGSTEVPAPLLDLGVGRESSAAALLRSLFPPLPPLAAAPIALNPVAAAGLAAASIAAATTMRAQQPKQQQQAAGAAELEESCADAAPPLAALAAIMDAGAPGGGARAPALEEGVPTARTPGAKRGLASSAVVSHLTEAGGDSEINGASRPTPAPCRVTCVGKPTSPPPTPAAVADTATSPAPHMTLARIAARAHAGSVAAATLTGGGGVRAPRVKHSAAGVPAPCSSLLGAVRSQLSLGMEGNENVGALANGLPAQQQPGCGERGEEPSLGAAWGGGG